MDTRNLERGAPAVSLRLHGLDVPPVDLDASFAGQGIAALERFANSGHVLWLFLFASAVLFSEFFLQGDVLVGSLDSTFNHYPNLLFGLRALRQGELGLWNPLIFAGVDFSTSFHHHILHPIHWPLALVPEDRVLHAVTAVQWLEIAFIGWFAFLTARRYTLTATGALFIGMVAELSGFTWFTITTYIGTHLLAAVAVGCYLIVSDRERRPLTQFLFLSLVFADILLMGHIGYIIAFGLPLVGIFVARNWSAWGGPGDRRIRGLTPPGSPDLAVGEPGAVRPWMSSLLNRLRRILGGHTLVTGLAFGWALLLALYRIIPVMHGLLYEQRVVGSMKLPITVNGAYFALTGCIPELLGLWHGDATDISRRLGMGGMHTQMHNLLYLGVAPMLLIGWSVTCGFRRGTMLLAAAYLILAIDPMVVMQPLSDIVGILIFPLVHDAILRAASTFVGFLCLVQAVRHIEREGLPAHDGRLRGFLVFAGMVLVAALVFWTKLAFEFRGDLAGSWRPLLLSMKVGVAAALAGTIVLAIRGRMTTSLSRWLVWGTGLFMLSSVTAVLIVGWQNRWLLETVLTLRGIVFSAAGGLWVAGVLVLLAALDVSRRMNLPNPSATTSRPWLATGMFLMLAALGLMIAPWTEGMNPRPMTTNVAAGVISLAKFLFLAAAALHILLLFHERRTAFRAQWVLPALGLLTFGDLLAAQKLYGPVGTIPFLSTALLYPDRPGLDQTEAPRKKGDARQNLIANAVLGGEKHPDGWSLGGGNVACKLKPAGSTTVAAVQNRGSDIAALFQDVPVSAEDFQWNAGAWVRTSKKDCVYVMVTGANAGAESVRHTGSGQWEWLASTIKEQNLGKTRFHVVLTGGSDAEIHAPQLLNLDPAPPLHRPEGPVLETPSLARSREAPIEFDLRQYRVSLPTQFVGWQESEVVGNIAMVYGVPTYGGVDSDVKQGLYELIANFEGESQQGPQRWNHRMGFMGNVENPRVLDLLGVKYVGAKGGPVVRPDAIARLSLFESAEVETKPSQALARLKDASFDPRTSVVVNGGSGLSPVSRARFKPIPFESPSTSRLNAHVDCGRPSLLLFNDSFSPDWTCRCNGERLTVHKANGNFMAVYLPAGPCEILWEFRPRAVVLGQFSAGLALLWSAIAGFGLARRIGRRSDRRLPQAEVREPGRLAA